MKYRVNSYIDILGKLCYIIEYNKTDKDYEEDWFELEDIEDESMINDIVNLLNSKYSKEPTHKYNKQ